MGNDLSPLTDALWCPPVDQVSHPPSADCATGCRVSLYVPEITLRLRMSVDRETSTGGITGQYHKSGKLARTS